MISRRKLLGAIGLAPLALTMPRLAAAASPEVFSDAGLAIRGYDPVAYFTQSAPVLGMAEYALMWRGTMWHFASAASMEAFEMNPEAYAPQYGGYCAFAMSRGAIATTVPEAWTIYEDRLYLNYSDFVRGQWSNDIPGNIELANGYWPGILDA
ncbi:MAG: YHS domain protein [Rhodobacteraceae bacterium]|nr:YHS domain protein [Paracoccaceae bacterium]